MFHVVEYVNDGAAEPEGAREDAARSGAHRIIGDAPLDDKAGGPAGRNGGRNDVVGTLNPRGVVGAARNDAAHRCAPDGISKPKESEKDEKWSRYHVHFQ